MTEGKDDIGPAMIILFAQVLIAVALFGPLAWKLMYGVWPW